MTSTMTAAYLPGNSTVELRTVPVPTPGHGEVLLRMQSLHHLRLRHSLHLPRAPRQRPRGLPGRHRRPRALRPDRRRRPGCRRFEAGDRVIVYHISGCGVCNDCRRGYMISCTSEKYRRAYGWQRDGGMAEFMLAEEKDLIALPDPLSYADGAQVACGFGTVYEGLEKIGINGNHAVLITGLGPVGLATGALCRKLGAQKIIGIDVVPERMRAGAKLGLCDTVLASGPDNVAEVQDLTRRPRRRARRRLLRQRRSARHRHSRHAQVGTHRVSRRRRPRRVQSLARHHSRPEDHLRIVGHIHLAHGRAGRAPGALEPASGRAHHAPFPLEHVGDAYA